MNPSSSAVASSVTKASTSKTPCCSKVGIKRGPWTPEEDQLLADYITKDGVGRWRTLPKRAGLLRCGKSCRLRWMNYLRPSLKRGHIAPDEEDLILRLHRLLGNRWSLIAGRIPGRTDNEIKNFWNTHLSKKLIRQGIDPRTHKPLSPYNTPEIEHDQATLSNPNPNSQELEVIYGSYQPIANKSSEIIQVANMGQSQNPIFDDGNKHNNEGLTMGLQSNNRNNNEAYVDMCNEDMFSSFIDSLINENVVVNQEQPFHHATNWDAQFKSTIDTSAQMQNMDNYGV